MLYMNNRTQKFQLKINSNISAKLKCASFFEFRKYFAVTDLPTYLGLQ